MQAGDVKLGKVFASDHQMVIPLFQRPYVWGQEMNWEPLWQDIRLAAEEFEAEDPEDPPSIPRTYFLGAVVLQERRRPPKRLASSHIIDGQQRLTTLQVLLAAARFVAASLLADSVAGQLESLVENRPKTIHAEFPDDRYKVWPLPQDRDAFLWAVRDPNDLASPPDSDHQLVKARRWFEKEIAEWASGAPDPADRLEALHFSLQDRMQLVEITLDPSDDPQVIFEALNYRGVPLAAADLVKNLLFQGVEAQGDGKQAEQLLTQYWLELDGKHWRGSVTTGRIKRAQVDLLLAYWLTIRSKQEVLVDHLYGSFKTWMETTELSAAEVIQDIRRFADTYRRIEALPLGEPAARLLDNMMATNTTTPWPILLYLHAEDIPQDERDLAARSIDTFLMRRGVCGMTTKDYNRLFLQVLAAAQAAPSAEVGRTVLQTLAKQTADSRVWPDDDSFYDALRDSRFYEMVPKPRIRTLLFGIENHLRSPKADVQEKLRCNGTKLHIEHVMPRKWGDHWGLGANASDDAKAEREDLIHRLGNLTLASPGLNASMSNGPWSKKKIDLSQHSTFLLTTASVLAAPGGMAWPDDAWLQAWDHLHIGVRATWLVSSAFEIWPSPADLLEQSGLPAIAPAADDELGFQLPSAVNEDDPA